ncbi:hypothetical protein BDW02DRAFT_564200 [Decorospora gaudefroyi]|uniref:Uncharacterized protein n=1 Tax=Decorospora gaudefroyi TaxID=184978 RepID=A0A6A5KPS0_9PLEO|nr:hypothetical protein BDW02DRAFT_564200 [Decorospora gaudefroyi]
MPHPSIGPPATATAIIVTELNTIQVQQQQQQTSHYSNISQDPNVITTPTPPPMTDHYNQTIHTRDLNARLHHSLHAGHSSPQSSHGDASPRPILSQRRARSSSSMESDFMPRFTKSSTMSTTDTNDSSNSQSFGTGLHVVRAEPSAQTHRQSVGVAAGEFSKPRVHQRSRRDVSTPATELEGQKEFKYYGRHGNQWLFNDFSVTDAVSKGFKRVFTRENSGKDWYEDRDR